MTLYYKLVYVMKCHDLLPITQIMVMLNCYMLAMPGDSYLSHWYNVCNNTRNLKQTLGVYFRWGLLYKLMYKSQCQNSSKFLSSQYFVKTTDQIIISIFSYDTTDHA